MHVFLTGATGFIGRAVVLRLLRDGHRLSAWVRDAQRARSLLGAEVEPVPASGGLEALVVEMARADAVINLAGENVLGKRWTAKRRRALRDSRVGLTEQLVAAMERAEPRPRVLVSASAVGYYGDGGQSALDESSPAGEDFLARLCVDWEAAARGAEALGVRVVTPRMGIVLGIGGGALDSMLPLFRKGLGGRLGKGDQIWPWIHLRDLAAIYARAIGDEALAGAFNASAPEPVSNAALSDALAAALGRTAKLPVPAAALKARFGRAASALLEGQNARPARLLEAGFDFAFSELGPALDDLLHSGRVDIGPAREVPASDYLARRKPKYLLQATTDMPAGRDEVFAFFSRAANLALVTPADLAFTFTSENDPPMEAGTTIDYRIRLGALPLGWTTRIERVEPGALFIDSQLKGPYKSWWHEHHFADGPAGGTRMQDRVFYSPPAGPLGRAAQSTFVRPELERIFAYREQAIRLRFG